MVTAFVVIFTFALLLLAGLVIDGGLTLAARVQAIDEAQAAARAGAQAINLPLYRSTGQVVLDPSQARQAAESYLAVGGLAVFAGHEIDRRVLDFQAFLGQEHFHHPRIGSDGIVEFHLRCSPSP